MKETQLDLDKLRWPTVITVNSGHGTVAKDVQAVIDRMGRLYFRIQDVKEDWFTPGFYVMRSVAGQEVTERILEKSVLFVDDQPVCLQVSVASV